jgi:hypothetical protein
VAERWSASPLARSEAQIDLLELRDRQFGKTGSLGEHFKKMLERAKHSFPHGESVQQPAEVRMRWRVGDTWSGEGSTGHQRA